VTVSYPKRLIEVDLPIARISAHARREKSIRHGHISTLHIWWARRPLAACRAVICAALWPDPADPLCPPPFREAAAKSLVAFARRFYPERINEEGQQLQETASTESLARWEVFAKEDPLLDPTDPAHQNVLRFALLDFIADFANWDNSTVPAYLETSRALTQAAHESLGGVSGTRPLVVDPFAGGGSIPLEALRIGADAFASDLNPVPVLLNKVVLRYVPRFRDDLVGEFRKQAKLIKQRAEKELAEFYPDDADGAKAAAYLFARTILSDAPGQDKLPIEVPLVRSTFLSKRGAQSRSIEWKRNRTGEIELEEVEVALADGRAQKIRRIVTEIVESTSQARPSTATSRGGAATCPVSGYTTSVERVREQLSSRFGGAADARLMCVVTSPKEGPSKNYRTPVRGDFDALAAASVRVRKMAEDWADRLPLLPNGKLNHLRGFFNVVLYGMTNWHLLFSPRQSLSIATLARLINEAGDRVSRERGEEFREAVQTCLAMALGRWVDYSSSLCMWAASGEFVCHTFGRQALPMVWDFAEVNPLAETGWSGACDWVSRVLENVNDSRLHPGVVESASALHSPLPSDSADAIVTDPPYYAAIPYADLSDFFCSWLARCLGNVHAELFPSDVAPKDEECVSLAHRAAMYRHKDGAWFERMMGVACTEARRVDKHTGIGVFVFANKETSGWEAMLNALVSSGWIITASWPIDTERGGRLRARNSAALASSVHLVCRPREDADGKVTESVGEWRNVLGELPQRIHDWMPRLASEGVVGADAIFACLGPALEIFSRYSRVEKSSGEAATLREYLEQVWAAVSTEAISMIFRDADAAGLEPDARLTAMWLWTLGGGSAGPNGKGPNGGRLAEGGEDQSDDSDDDDAESTGRGAAKASGFVLEYDAARKIAQGLGANLEKLESLVEIKGDKARLLPVSERTQFLFGKKETGEIAGEGTKRKKKGKQKSLFEEMTETDAEGSAWGELKGPPPGSTVLDRVHQSMVLFAAGRGELMKRFLVEDGVGKDSRFY
jgi:adenine-specific DNA methylase